MSLYALVVAIVLIGLALAAINRWIPLEPGIKRLLNIVVIAALVLFCLMAFGVFDHLKDIKVPRIP